MGLIQCHRISNLAFNEMNFTLNESSEKEYLGRRRVPMGNLRVELEFDRIYYFQVLRKSLYLELSS